MNAPDPDRSRRKVSAGEWVFRHGEAADCAYLIESGKVELVRGAGRRRSDRIALGADELFGETALLNDAPRDVSALVTEDTALLIVPRSMLDDGFRQAAPLLRHLVEVLLRRSPDRRPDDPAWVESENDKRVMLEKLRLACAIEVGLRQQEFALHYQPIVRLRDERLMGWEALVRWNRQEGPPTPPGAFVPGAEESGQILPLGRWILREACAHLARVNAARKPRTAAQFISVNVSARQFEDPQFLPTLRRALREHRLAPGQLKLEVTETALARNLDAASALLRRCRSLGVRIALDDFGTGYSSLVALREFPVDTLKLDARFIRRLHRSEPDRRIVRSVVALARAFGADVIAEGVEQRAQVQHLRALKIDFAQGFLFGRGEPAAVAP